VFSQIGSRLYAVAPSQWIAQEAKRSSLLRDCRIEVIPNGIDVQIFRPREQQMARELLDIPPGVRVLLYVAQPVDRWEKGFMYVVEALQQVKDWRDLFLVIAGGGKIPAEVPVQHLRLGRVRDERILSLAYSAADIFVMPSLRETFGVTAIEAMAAGTPVVAFATGGIRETVREGITGRLVPTGDARALGQRIEELLQDPSSRSRMAANGRRTAMEEYSLPVIAKHHAEFCARIAELPRPVWESRPIPEPQNALGIN
jgi:glycosyltransferase involved in cell wall biosynthesis